MDLHRYRLGQRRDTHAWLAMAVFLAASAIEIAHAIAGLRWGAFTHLGSDLGLVNAALWLVAAFSLVSRRLSSFPLVVYAAGGLLVHAGFVGIADERLAALGFLIGFALATVSILQHMSGFTRVNVPEPQAVPVRATRPSYA